MLSLLYNYIPMLVFFPKLRMSPLYMHRVRVHLSGAAMLHCYSSTEQTNL